MCKLVLIIYICNLIPEFNEYGNLPHGIHWVSIQEIEDKLCFSPRRIELFKKLKEAIGILSSCGCNIIYIDGSFASIKENPGDIDVCCDYSALNPDKLYETEPCFFDLAHPRTAQKDRFECEFFPANIVAEPPSKLYLDFFQEDRDGNPKGIIGLNI